jgi:hypothetical protein
LEVLAEGGVAGGVVVVEHGGRACAREGEK